MKYYKPFINNTIELYTAIANAPQKILVLKKGEEFYPHNHEHEIAILTKGLCKTFIIDTLGEERFMWILEPYSVITFPSDSQLLQKLVAVNTVELAIIDKKIFETLLFKNKSLFDNYINFIYNKYAYCVEKLISTDIHNSQFKVYSLLLQLTYKFGKPNQNNQIILKNIFTRDDFASITGVHRSNVIKYLTHLEDLNIIEKNRTTIIIKDITSLKKITSSLDESLD